MSTGNKRIVHVSEHIARGDITSSEVFDYDHVIDLRHTDAGVARPMEEGVLKRLASYQIEYEQVPLNLSCVSSDVAGTLSSMVREKSGAVLLLTKNMDALARLFVESGIKFVFRERFEGVSVSQAAAAGAGVIQFPLVKSQSAEAAVHA